LLLLAIFSFAFLFRVAVIFHNEYPPSSDIGFHSSIINLILDEGELPRWNSYHMGGEPLATPPGFHFFVSILILLTGMPLLFAQLITAAFFSSFIVFPAYLVSKKMWRSHSAGFLAALFATISALSIEMVSWGGYANVVSLALIVVIFYLFLKELDQPSHFDLLMGMLLFGSLILTHTFSLFVFFPILILYFVSLLIGKALKLENIELRKTLRFFTVSVASGILAVSPWLLRVFSFYMGASAEGVLLGGMEDNRNLILANRSVDVIILTLLVVLIPAFFMFKASRKTYADNGSLLLVAWFLVPVVMTQAYIFGVFVDYSRFMYFIDFPGILIISAALFYLFRYTSIAINKVPRIKWNSVKKLVSALVFIASLFAFIVVSPWSIFPDEAIERVNFYTTLYKPEATAMEWIQNRTPESSVFVADHLYGWWLSGVGKRTTLSAASSEFLLYSHEVEVAKSAQLLFDTNYYFDNGLIQIRDNGGYVSEKDIEFSIELGSGESFPIFYSKEEGVVFWYVIYSNGREVNGIRTVAEMEMVGTPVITKDENSVTLRVQYEDELFAVNRTLILKRGERFAELSYDIEVKDFQTNLYQVWLNLYVGEGNMTYNEPISWYGLYYGNQMCGQVIFPRDLPSQIKHIEKDPRVETLFVYQRPRTLNIKTLIGVFDAQGLSWPDEVEEKYFEFLASPHEQETTAPLSVWNYTEMIKKYDVSYVVCRDQKIYPKFWEDPNFRFVFNSGNVAVFQVVK
jgi:hypothetical protein